jgi:L-asparaginase II
MSAVPGLIAKGGAEGMYGGALPDGRGVAVKISDGGARAAVPVVVGLLRKLGLDGEALARWATAPVFGHGEVVGEVRAAEF